MNLKDNNIISFVFVALILNIFVEVSAVPVYPEYSGNTVFEPVYPSQRFINNSRGRDLPNNILVLMVEFEDVKFTTESVYPDYLAHDEIYFSKYLEHLSEYYRDNSHGNYPLSLDNFTIHPEVITAPNNMGFYGEDNSGKTSLLVSDAISLVDNAIDFSSYDGFIVFHAGAGAEADIEPPNPELIISTFLSRRSFQSYFDPENDDYPGLETDDNIYLTEFVVCPETLWQPDSVEPDENGENGSPIYSFFGVLAHHFGHLIGLPTLFDNRSANGNSRGIGGFGIMGIGAWNAMGYVPAPPSAWSRYYLGWEDVLEIDSNIEGQTITYPNAKCDTTKLIKIEISDSEYFLIENSQQNPDNSFFVNADNDTLATFTFPISENQEYYPNDHPYGGQPKFNFMNNSYEGCEWRFYLPGYAYGDNPDLDGSGLLIWHIDELVLFEKFSPDFEVNHPNGDAYHKGVDLEEADGRQDLDTFYTTVFGSKDDSYRDGNNNYFGAQIHNGIYSSPTSESYYGGSRIEIKNISKSDTIMTLSVDFGWNLTANYTGEIDLPAAIIDFDSDGENEIFYPMPNGDLYIWKDDQEIFSHIFGDVNMTIPELYCWDELNATFLLPYTIEGNSSFLKMLNNEDGLIHELIFPNSKWVAPPVINNDNTNDNHAFIAQTNFDNSSSSILILDKELNTLELISFDKIFASNIMLKDNILAIIDSTWKVQQIAFSDYSISEIALEISEPKEIHSALWADINADDNLDYIVSTADSKLYCFHDDGEIFENFPIDIPLNIMNVPALADMDNNGFLDIIYGGENSFCLVDYLANITKPEYTITSPDSINMGGGAIIADLNNDGNLEIIGSMSRNRLCVWEKVSDNNYDVFSDFPISFPTSSSTYPLLGQYSQYDNSIFYATEDGAIYKEDIPNLDLNSVVWKTKYGNLQRTASYLEPLPQNQFNDDSIFIKDKIYFYPNPLSAIYNGTLVNGFYRERCINLNLLTSQDTDVEIKIFDVAGNKILSEIVYCNAYVQNGLLIDCSKLSSGVYFAIIKTENEILKKKFAIEK